MASWKEIERIRKNPAEARAIAQRLLKFPSIDMTDWEAMFLDTMADRPVDRGDLTTLQVEKLLQIRDDLTFVPTTRDGFSVQILMDKIHLGRNDLTEEDEEWFVRVRERDGYAIARKNIGRLLRLARELRLIDEEAAA
ncbi:MAG TPA: hypothetical protein VHA70_10085 [Bauldia sp.]|nr:hypothetical protein [Bauldia sp.]